MRWMDRLTVRWRAFAKRSHVEREIDAELQFHLDQQIEEHIAAGMSVHEARSSAVRSLGMLSAVKEQCRDSLGLRLVDQVRQDVRYAARTLVRNRVFTLVAVLTLALGIGANTAVFSLVNSLLLRTLPVKAPEGLVTISSDFAISRGFTAGAGWNYEMWNRLQERIDAFDGGFAWTTNRFNLAQSGEIRPVEVVFVSGGFFSTLGVQPFVGRPLNARDDVRSGGAEGPVAVISYDLWQRRFDGTADIVGRPLVIDRVPFTIVGVTPPEFFGIEVGRSFDVTLPLGTEPLINGKSAAIDQPRRLSLIIMLRLKPDQSLDGATAALRAMQPQILGDSAELPPFLQEPFTLVPAWTGISNGLRQLYERPLLILLVVVWIVLVIACVNLASLLLGRAAARRHELSVRLALGAQPGRLARQLLVESLLLAVVGAAMGLLFASWVSRALAIQLSTSVSQVVLPLALDWRVMGFTALVTAVTTMICGTAPALRAARIAPLDALKQRSIASRSGRRGLSRSSPATLSGGLVIVQIALSLVLLVVAGLFIRTFQGLANVPLGFDRDRVLLVNVDTARMPLERGARNRLYHQLVDTAAAMPGVAGAAGSMSTPGGGGAANLLVDARGRSADPARVIANFVTPGWFAAYGIPIRSGRDIATYDTEQSLPVVIVNEAFVRRFFPNRSAVGESFMTSEQTFLKGRTVVGVVGDAPYGSLHDVIPATIYLPLAQSVGLEPPGRTTVILSVRARAGSPLSLAPPMATALTAVDQDLAFSFRSLGDQVDASLQQERVLAMLAGFFGALALLLTGIGLYGVTAYAVTRRRAEIGIRMALGAPEGAVRRMFVLRSLLLTGVGVTIGLGAAFGITRFLSSLLFAISPLDPITHVAMTSLLLLVAGIASYVPARRATKVDPMVSLRCE